MTTAAINAAFARGYPRISREDATKAGQYLALAKLALDNALSELPTGHPLATEVFSSIRACEGAKDRLKGVLQGKEPDL